MINFPILFPFYLREIEKQIFYSKDVCKVETLDAIKINFILLVF